MIRQPYVVDRLVTVDLSKPDSSACLACVYLNEYKIAVAAFTLHGSDHKAVRGWKESLEKANSLYQVCNETLTLCGSLYFFVFCLYVPVHSLKYRTY